MGRYDFHGYRRENGRVGIRNHVVILPLDDLSNAACEAVANNIKGTLALPHAYGRLQFGEDLELFFRTLIGTGANPNVAACVVIGIEPGWTGRIVDGIAKTGKPVAGFAIEGNGDITTIADASRKAQEFVQWASERQREKCSIKELFISDQVRRERHDIGPGVLPDRRQPDRQASTRSASPPASARPPSSPAPRWSCAKRAATPEVRDKFMQMFNAYQERHRRHKTERPVRIAADQGQHRRRADDDRGEGVRQPRRRSARRRSSSTC